MPGEGGLCCFWSLWLSGTRACYPIPLPGLQSHTEHTSDPLLSIVGYDRVHVARVEFMRKQTIRVFPFSGDKVLLVAKVGKIHDLSHRGLLSSGIAGVCHLAQPVHYSFYYMYFCLRIHSLKQLWSIVPYNPNTWEAGRRTELEANLCCVMRPCSKQFLKYFAFYLLLSA